MLDLGKGTDDVVAPNLVVSALETILVDRISKHNCGYCSAVPDDLHCVQTHDRALRTTEASSHWPAFKREQILESEETIVLVLL